MAREKIGVVKVLIGEAIATHPGGEKRPLNVEYLVHPGEKITTGDFSKIEIQFSDGSRLYLGRNSEMVVNADILEPSEFTLASASEIEVIQAAIEAGYDPSTITQPPAAGTSDNDGSFFVALNHEAPRVTPVSGFETAGLTAPSGTPPLVDFLLDPDSDLIPSEQPQASPDQASITEDGPINPVVGNVLTNDSDPQGDPLTVVQVNGNPDNVGQPLQGQFGTVIINADGTYSYELNNNLPAVQTLNEGETLTETFTYTNSDGELTAASNLTITIQGADDGDPPVANPDTASVIEDGPVNPVVGNVLSNDSDPDGDPLSVAQVNGSPDNVGQLLQGQFGTVVINVDGTYSYELNNSLPAVQALNEGETLTETFAYTNSDGESTAASNLTITIEGADEPPPENNPPVANPDAASVIEDGPVNPVVGNVLSNDSDPDGDPLTVVQVNGGAENVGQPLQGQFGTVVINGDGTYNYELDNSLPAVQALNEGEMLTETFAYTNSDGESTAASNLTITIEGADEPSPPPPENNPPVANPDTASVIEDGPVNPVVGNVLSNDSDPDGDPLSVAQVNGSPDNVGQPLQGLFGTVVINGDGSYSYELTNSLPAVQALNEGETLTETFAYTNSDGESTANSNLTITIQGADEVPAENNPPVANPDSASITEDGEPNPITGNVLSNDSDPDGDTLSVVQVNGSPDNVGQPLQGQFGSVVINADGSYSYELDNSLPVVRELDQGDSLSDTFSYTNSDGEASATTNLVVTIQGADEPFTSTSFDFGGDIALPEGFLVESTPFVFNVDRSGDTSDAGSVNFSFNAGDTDANDFVGGSLPQGGVIDFAAGETEQTITVNVQGDIALEGNEAFSLSLNSPTGSATEVTIGQGTVTGTIIGDDNEVFDPSSTDSASESALASNDTIIPKDILFGSESEILADPPSLEGGTKSGAAGADTHGSSAPMFLGSLGSSVTSSLLDHHTTESNIDLV